jgi:acetylornithine deacetylase/succinyl-diaminopimelate desuccinylase-like protein
MLFPAVNDNRFFRKAGIPTFGITPTLLSQELLFTIHNNDERLPIDALHKGIEIYTSFIKRLIE